MNIPGELTEVAPISKFSGIITVVTFSVSN